MGFTKGSIVLDSENRAYYAGQTISGQIQFDQGKDKTIHGIYVSLKGFCKVHWTTRKTRRVNDRTEVYTVDHSSFEEYVNKKIFVFGNSDGGKQLNAGNYKFHFNFHIPESCPSSFEGSVGHIRYRVKAVMLTTEMFSSNKELFSFIRVESPLDLNADPYCKEPIEIEMSQSYCCWCFSSGFSEVKVTLPAGGYCLGQVIPIEVSCENNSSVEISRIALAIKKKTRYIALSVAGMKEDKEKVLEIKKGSVPRNTTRRWTVEMELPQIDVPNLSQCQYIDMKYYFTVTTEVGGCHSNQDDSRRIIIGTIPLEYNEDKTSGDQTPKEIEQVTSYPAPIMNQPVHTSPYPNNQPYPNSTPYPAVNAPYPNTPNMSIVPPYPNATPYPPGNQYSQNNQGYPGSTPNRMSPYPQGYPGAPNPGNSPVPSRGRTPSPVPPYPVNGAAMTSSPLRTGTFGFMVPGGDTVPTPSLPPGANIPYPLTPGNPYASASAPEPSTPDSVDKNLSVMSAATSNTPYNPDFMNEQRKDEK